MNVDTVARIGVYQVADEVANESLLPLILNTETIGHSLAVIVLDWEKPWCFVDILERWSRVLEEVTAHIEAPNGLSLIESKANGEFHRFLVPSVS